MSRAAMTMAVLASAALLACEQDQMLGDQHLRQLPEGACMLWEGSLVLPGPGENLLVDGPTACYPNTPVARMPDGRVSCDMVLRLSEQRTSESTLESPSGARSCDGLPFAVPLGDREPRFWPRFHERGGELCLVEQLPVFEEAPDEPGWYYDDVSRDCEPLGEVRLNPGEFELPEGFVATTSCAYAYGPPESPGGVPVPVDPTTCEQPSGSADDVGAFCQVAPMPEFAPYPRFVLVTGSGQCQTGACLAYTSEYETLAESSAPTHDPSAKDRPACREGLQGADCDPTEQGPAYCTCRCDGEPHDGRPLCECPTGFACTPLLLGGPEGLAGSYCVAEPD